MNFELILYVLAIGGVFCFFNIQPILSPNSKKLNWTWWEAILVAIFLYYGGQIIGSVFASFVPALRGWDDAEILRWLQKTVAGRFYLILLIEAVSISLLYAFLRIRRSSLKAIGLFGKPSWRDLGLVAIGFGVYLLVYIIVASLADLFITGLNVDQKQQIGFEAAKGLQLIPVFISLVVLPPIAEELLTRGFLYTGLRSKFKKVGAALITSALFGLAHLQAGSGAPLLWIAAIDTFVLSLVLIELKERSGGKLWAPIGLHALKNGIAFVGIFVLNIAG